MFNEADQPEEPPVRKQDWKKGMLSQINFEFQKPETRFGRSFRIVLTIGLVAIFVGYTLVTK